MRVCGMPQKVGRRRKPEIKPLYVQPEDSLKRCKGAFFSGKPQYRSRNQNHAENTWGRICSGTMKYGSSK